VKTLLQLNPLPTLRQSLEIDEDLPAETARFWRHGPGVVLGLRDMRLSRAEDAVREFREMGLDVHVRASGGALVVLDRGVLNIALGFRGESLPSIDEGYQLMTVLLTRGLATWGLTALSGEVDRSICPGRSDLSVAGRKVAGLSQRRRHAFVLVHAFLLVEGTGRARGLVAESFYRRAGGDPGTIRPDSMISMAEAADMAVSVEEVASRLLPLAQDLSCPGDSHAGFGRR